MANKINSVERILIGVIADPETVIGFLMAGIGESLSGTTVRSNYMIVFKDTLDYEIEKFFKALYQCPNIGVILLSNEVAQILKYAIQQKKRVLPILLVMPKKTELSRD